MKKMLFFLGVALVTLLFTACGDVVTDQAQVADLVKSLRDNPNEWSAGVIDEGKAIHLERKGQVLLFSTLEEKIGFKRHARSLNLDPGGVTLLPETTSFAGEALVALRMAIQPFADTALEQQFLREELKKVIKVEQ